MVFSRYETRFGRLEWWQIGSQMSARSDDGKQQLVVRAEMGEDPQGSELRKEVGEGQLPLPPIPPLETTALSPTQGLVAAPETATRDAPPALMPADSDPGMGSPASPERVMRKRMVMVEDPKSNLLWRPSLIVAMVIIAINVLRWIFGYPLFEGGNFLRVAAVSGTAFIVVLFAKVMWNSLLEPIVRGIVAAWNFMWREHKTWLAVIIASVGAGLTVYFAYMGRWQQLEPHMYGLCFGAFILFALWNFSLLTAGYRGLVDRQVTERAVWTWRLHFFAGLAAWPLAHALWYKYVAAWLNGTVVEAFGTFVVSYIIALTVALVTGLIGHFIIRFWGELRGLVQTTREKTEAALMPRKVRVMMFAVSLVAVIIALGVGRNLWGVSSDGGAFEALVAVLVAVVVGIIYRFVEGPALEHAANEEITWGVGKEVLGAWAFALLTYLTTFATIFALLTAPYLFAMRKHNAEEAVGTYIAASEARAKKRADGKEGEQKEFYLKAIERMTQGKAQVESATTEVELEKGMRTFSEGATKVSVVVRESDRDEFLKSLVIPPRPSVLRQGLNAAGILLGIKKTSDPGCYYSSEDAVGAASLAIFTDMLIPLLASLFAIVRLVRRKRAIEVEEEVVSPPSKAA